MTKSRPLIVQKYGGSSLATPDHIRRVARHIIERKDSDCDLIVVVSAMGKTTDQLVKLAHEVNPNPGKRETDMLMSSGEQISMAALALAINATGKYSAISLTGAQVGILTDSNHSQARILEIVGERVRQALAQNKIVIVAGFQGVSVDNEITTLGRGGSDTTAVAIAAALHADYCEIMSDIDGIYTADPKTSPNAKRIDKIHYDHALQLAAAGAKMLHKTSVEFAKRHKINLSLGSSMSGHIGTIVNDWPMDKGRVTGVTVDTDLMILHFSLGQADALRIPQLFSQQRIHLKLWQAVQGLCLAGVARGDANFALRLLQERSTNISSSDDLALLSIIGDGIGVGTSVSEDFFAILDKLNIRYEAVISDDLFVKVLCPAARVKAAQEEVHNQLIF